ncbi:hypothetical protein FRB94_006570 [Tulasnella sp. JGI-2019a]|nr:hypothetical protein FRB93_012089 [Tulasnella sp. JGI-2019a]KAG9012202.1 hypothetical protein FRB94_006570 [Tulasnella sp. JGI-2019a]KAG9036337.1 hypothetical protein FRB95_009259 [Tulasnella sp. JGI-2019a]
MSVAMLSPPTPASFSAVDGKNDGFLNFDAVHAGRCTLLEHHMLLVRLAHEVIGSLPAGALTTFSRDDARATRSTAGSTRSSSGSGPNPPATGTTTSSASPSMRGSDAMSPLGSRYSPGDSVVPSDAGDAPSDGRSYHLEVVQHPERVSELGATAVLSRLPLQPALVVRLVVRDTSRNIIPAHTEMPFLAAHINLYSADGSEPIDLADGPDRPRMLYGTLVASLQSLVDLDGQPGMFFIFPDISVRTRGRYTLRVNLLRLSGPTGGSHVMPEGMRNGALTWVMTNPFSVVLQSEYSAPPATPLTNSFHRQGARMYTPFQPR